MPCARGGNSRTPIADLLRKGLACSSAPGPQSTAPRITTDSETGVPVIMCKQAAAPDEEMTTERVADILLAQEVEWRHAAGR